MSKPTLRPILYIEDNPFELDSLTELLERAGFPVVPVATVEAARAFLQSHAVQLILISINTAESMNDHRDVKLVNDPLYAQIAKIIIMVNQSDPNPPVIKREQVVIATVYKEDPQRLEKLIAAVKTHVAQMLSLIC